MKLVPLQTNRSETLLSEGADANKRANKAPGRLAFNAVLDRLQTPSETNDPRSDRAAAELLRLKMMQSSLSLGTEEEMPQLQETLPNLLRGVIGNGYGVLASRPKDAGAVTPGEAAPKASTEEPLLDGILQSAAGFLGTPYVFGGEGPSGIDCSSFVQHVFQQHQIDLPRTAREQIQVGSDVPPHELRKGDLVFFRTYASYPSHVGIYLGDGKMIHASSGKGEVTVSPIDSEYFRSRYLGAKRIV